MGLSMLVETAPHATESPEPGPVSSRRAPRVERPNIVVVGLGMVGQRVCDELSSKSTLRSHRIVVFGKEQIAAYDRVHLCDVVRGSAPEQLVLARPEWYREHKIRVQRGDAVIAIDRGERLVRTQSGRVQGYDHLILATGAIPILGKLPGNDGPNVRALRTTDDATFIRERTLHCVRVGLPVVIVGGGLLGIELAEELVDLGAQVIVLESADFPLSRQLEKSAGELLKRLLEKPNLALRTRVRVTKFVSNGGSTLVEIEGSEPIRCGLVVPAMGIRPNDKLAKEAGLRCDIFGGIEVNDQLLTSDPHISAVGECARHRGTTYGLVAPGYAMAEVVAKRLAGSQVTFSEVQVGTRLKSRHVDLTVVGESAATGLGVKTSIVEGHGTYRRLLTRRGRVIGAVAVGKWQDLPRVQQAMARGEKLRPKQFKRFLADEAMWSKDAGLSLKVWPDIATVCTCVGVTCGSLRSAVNDGCANVEALAERTGASTVCGSCRPLLSSLVDEQPEAPAELSRWMVALSLISLLGSLAFFALPAIPYGTSIQDDRLDVLWRTPLYKQISGFSLAGLFALSIVFSMRKRIKRLSFGDFETWRVVHAAVGVLCLGGGFLHTGFRLGNQLDFALASVFLGTLALGGVAGGWELLEGYLTPNSARALRGWLIRSHIYLLWPLPVLLVMHVAKVYFF